jgi:fermentation-respiration switch protein FrsA (DUF1100 family)
MIRATVGIEGARGKSGGRRRGWRRHARNTLAGAGLLAGGALAAGAGIGYYIAHKITRPAKPASDDGYVMSPYETGADYEEVSFPAAHGAHCDHTIQAWWLRRPETNRVVVCCTGYRGSKSYLIGIGTALWRAGFNVLLFDYYGHGADKGGRRISLGYHEVNDFLAALDYAERRVPGGRIGVIGYSMGGSVAILGTPRRSEVRALVADSPFARHADVVAYNVERTLRAPVGRLFVRIVDYYLPLLAGYRHADVEPIRSIGALAPRPLLLIHGTADDMIPVDHAYRIFAAAGEPKELWLADGAAHCGAYFLDRPAYCRRVIAFFERHLGAGKETPGQEDTLQALQRETPTAPLPDLPERPAAQTPAPTRRRRATA